MKKRIKAFGLGLFKGSFSGIVMYLLTMTLVQAAFPAKYYEVYVKYRAGGCYETKKVVLQASSTNEAKQRAQKITQFALDVEVVKFKELR